MDTNNDLLMAHAAGLLGTHPDAPEVVVDQVGDDGVRRTGLRGPDGQAVLEDRPGGGRTLLSNGTVFSVNEAGDGLDVRFTARKHLDVAWRAAARSAEVLNADGRADEAGQALEAAQVLRRLHDASGS